jgi:hypothetical protein
MCLIFVHDVNAKHVLSCQLAIGGASGGTENVLAVNKMLRQPIPPSINATRFARVVAGMRYAMHMKGYVAKTYLQIGI